MTNTAIRRSCVAGNVAKRRLSTFAIATDKWVKAGSPVRTDEEVAAIIPLDSILCSSELLEVNHHASSMRPPHVEISVRVVSRIST